MQRREGRLLSDYGKEKVEILKGLEENAEKALRQIESPEPDEDGELYNALYELRSFCDSYLADSASAGTIIKYLW